MVPISYRHRLPAPASRLAKSFSKPLYRIDSGACSSVRQSYKDVSVRWQWLKAATLLYCISNPERHQSFKNSAPFRVRSPFTRPGALTGRPDGTRLCRIENSPTGTNTASRYGMSFIGAPQRAHRVPSRTAFPHDGVECGRQEADPSGWIGGWVFLTL